MGEEQSEIKTEWRKSVELLLKKWGEQASCYRYLHYKSYYKFKRKNIGITIPVIVLQSICGSASIGLNSLFAEEYQHLAQVIVGSVTIMTSILVTIANFLQWAELKQSHHSAMISYGKLSRDIRTTLSLIRDDRPDAGFYLQHCKHTLDRLTEDSPTIPDDIAKSFKKKYKDDNNFEKPEVCDGLKEVEIESSFAKIDDVANLVQKISQNENKKKIVKIMNQDKVRQELNNVVEEETVKAVASKLDDVVLDINNNLISDSSDDDLEITNFSKGVVDEVLKNVKEKN